MPTAACGCCWGPARRRSRAPRGPAIRSSSPSVTYTVQPLADGSLNLLNPKGKKVGHFAAPLTATGPGPLALAGSGSYRGSLVFTPNGRGGVDTVNSVGLEDYVRGVISWEMPSGWAAEALKVQAVAARTFAITDSVGGVAVRRLR